VNPQTIKPFDKQGAIDRPACAVCAAWRKPCKACQADAIIRNELIAAWNHGKTTSGGLGSTLLPMQGQPYHERQVRLTREQREIAAWMRGPTVTLGERLSDESRAAVGA
jgi:hypothetical protein